MGALVIRDDGVDLFRNAAHDAAPDRSRHEARPRSAVSILSFFGFRRYGIRGASIGERQQIGRTTTQERP